MISFIVLSVSKLDSKPNLPKKSITGNVRDSSMFQSNTFFISRQVKSSVDTKKNSAVYYFSSYPNVCSNVLELLEVHYVVKQTPGNISKLHFHFFRDRAFSHKTSWNTVKTVWNIYESATYGSVFSWSVLMWITGFANFSCILFALQFILTNCLFSLSNLTLYFLYTIVASCVKYYVYVV